MGRNHLTGRHGDAANAVLATAEQLQPPAAVAQSLALAAADRSNKAEAAA